MDHFGNAYEISTIEMRQIQARIGPILVDGRAEQTDGTCGTHTGMCPGRVLIEQEKYLRLPARCFFQSDYPRN